MQILKSKLKSKSKGVTLVELSIVLAILGILIVATISGKSLIDISRATATIQQMSDRELAFQVFSSTYDCIPGDCGTTTVISALGVTGVGDADSKVEAYVSGSIANELAFFEEHLVKAQLFNRSISATVAGTSQGAGNVLVQILPAAKIPGSYLSVMTVGTLGTYHIVGGASAAENVINNVLVAYPSLFKIVDSKIDDGSGTAGNTLCLASIAANTTTLTGQAYTSSSCVMVAKMGV